MKKVSIAIPSIYPERLKVALDSIQQNTANVDYEVIVVGSETLKKVIEGREKVKHILELKEEGIVAASGKAFKVSDSEYYVGFSDSAIATENWLYNMLKFLKENENNKPLSGSFRIKQNSGEEIKQGYINKILYPLYPCVKTETIRKLGGGWWGRGYYHYYADIDFGMRIWKAGGRVLVCPNAWVIDLNVRDDGWRKRRETIHTDEITFYKYWKYDLKLLEVLDWRYWIEFRFIRDIIRKVKKIAK